MCCLIFISVYDFLLFLFVVVELCSCVSFSDVDCFVFVCLTCHVMAPSLVFYLFYIFVYYYLFSMCFIFCLLVFVFYF